MSASAIVIMFAGFLVIVLPIALRVVVVLITAARGMVMVIRMRILMVMMIVIAGFAVSMVVGAQIESAVSVEEIKASHEEHSDAGYQRVDAETRIEVFFNPSCHVEIEEDRTPGHEGENCQDLKKFFHCPVIWIGSKADPEIAENTDSKEEAYCQRDHEFGPKDGEIHEDEFHIHHRAIDEEGEFR